MLTTTTDVGEAAREDEGRDGTASDDGRTRSHIGPRNSLVVDQFGCGDPSAPADPDAQRGREQLSGRTLGRWAYAYNSKGALGHGQFSCVDSLRD